MNDWVLILRDGKEIGRIIVLGVLADGMITGVRFSLNGEPRIRRQLTMAIQRNTESVSIRGGSKPTNLSIYFDGVIAAASAVGKRMGFAIDVHNETVNLVPEYSEGDPVE